MRILRYVAFGLGGIATLAAALALVLAFTFDAARLKAEAARTVREQTQRTLDIEGSPELSFWPSIGVKLGRTRLSERASDAPFVSLERAHVSLAILPLLRRQIVVERLSAQGLQASIVRRADGRFNFDDLLSQDKQDSKSPMRLAVDGIELADSAISFRDEQLGRSLALSGLQLVTGRLGGEAKGTLQLSGKLAAEVPKAILQLKLAGQYELDQPARRYAASALRGSLSGELGDARQLEVALSLGAARSQAGVLRIESAVVEGRGKLAADDLSLRLEMPAFELGPDRATAKDVRVAARLTGRDRRAEAKLGLGGIEGNPGALRAARFSLDADAASAGQSLKLAAASALQADLDAWKLELPVLKGTLELASPALPMKSVRLPLDGSLRADLARQSAAAQLSTAFDETRARVRIALERFAPLQASFDAEADRLNVDRYLPPARQTDAPGPAQERPIDYSVLKGFTLAGALRVGFLQVSNVKVDNLRLELRVRDGRLEVNPLSASLYQGALSGSLRANAANQQVALRQTLTDVSIGPLLRDAADKDLIEGRGSVVIDVVSSGGNVSALKRGLNGSARVNLRDGAIKGINLAKSLREIKAALGASASRETVQRASRTEKTDFSELSASLALRAGVAHNEDLSVKSPMLRMGGAGDIDIGRGTVNYLARASIVATAAGQEGRDLMQLRGVTVPVRVTGPFENLSYSLQLGQLMTEAAKAQVGERAGAATQQLGRQATEKLLKDGLKGLSK